MLPPFGLLQFFPNLMSAILLDPLVCFPPECMTDTNFFFPRGQFCRKRKKTTHQPNIPVFIPNIRKIGY